jgi:hypothetical protein
LTNSKYGYLINVQVMSGVTVNDGVSSADAELTMYLGKACDFINDALKVVAFVPMDPVPAVVDTIAEFYASGLYLARNNLPDGQTQHPNVVLAEKKLAEYKASLRRGYKLVSNLSLSVR